jgi:hypothetical protein
MIIENQRRRVRIGLLTSLILNGILIVLALTVVNRQDRSSSLVRLLDFLSGPSNAVAEVVAPRGHDAAHFVGGAIVSVVLSILLYGVVVWFLLSLPVWWRDRR